MRESRMRGQKMNSYSVTARPLTSMHAHFVDLKCHFAILYLDGRITRHNIMIALYHRGTLTR